MLPSRKNRSAQTTGTRNQSGPWQQAASIHSGRQKQGGGEIKNKKREENPENKTKRRKARRTRVVKEAGKVSRRRGARGFNVHFREHRRLTRARSEHAHARQPVQQGCARALWYSHHSSGSNLRCQKARYRHFGDVGDVLDRVLCGDVLDNVAVLLVHAKV